MEHKEKDNSLKKTWKETGKTRFFELLKQFKGEDISDIVLESRALWQEAFDEEGKKEKVIICADERVVPLSGEFKIGIAGQLILADEKKQDNFINRWKGKIKIVRSHDGCGAAGIAWGKLSEEKKKSFLGNTKQVGSMLNIEPKNSNGSGLNPEPTTKGMDVLGSADLYGTCHSYDLAKKLGARFEHTHFSGMRGHNEFHDARMIFWSADPNFDPSALLANNFLPPHFLANGPAFDLNEDYCREELKILAGIALGDHGFGKLFDGKNPFYIISVGKDAEKLNEIAKIILKNLKNRISFKYCGK